MPIRLLIAALACLGLVACAGGPRTRQEMLAATPDVTRVCSDVDVKVATEHLRKIWATCYGRASQFNMAPSGTGGLVAYRTSELQVFELKTPEGSSLYVRLVNPPGNLPTPLSNAILLMADVQPSAQCRSEVVMRTTTSHWLERAEASALMFQAYKPGSLFSCSQ